jgi:hypothetical protein
MPTAAPVRLETNGAELELLEDFGQRRHWLQGRAVSNGTQLELRLADGTWLLGTYEWSGMAARWPGLRVRLHVRQEPENGRPIYAVMAMPPQAIVRFPEP